MHKYNKAESPNFFRALKDEGIISYDEFIFLTSILRSSEEEFKIPFELMDTSKNGEIEVQEYDQFCSFARKSRKITNPPRNLLNETTLKAYFFGGPNFDQALTFCKFGIFLQNFHLEIFDAEFKAFSGGQDVITATNFVRMITKYTKLTIEEQNFMLSNVQDQMVSYEDALLFDQLLRNFEDLTVAMRFYTNAGNNIGLKEFKRAAKICLDGKNLPESISSIIFNMFPISGKVYLFYNMNH